MTSRKQFEQFIMRSSSDIDSIMESASQALARMDYLECEALCVQALARARAEANWAYYARILMPLQESRRQRRMIAAEGMIRLGTASLNGEPASWLEHMRAGCIALTSPHTAEHAQIFSTRAQQQRQFVEVLFVDDISTQGWRLCSFTGPMQRAKVDAPPQTWQDRWLSDADRAAASNWFMDACEMLGDGAIRQVKAQSGTVQRLAELERCLEVVTDHEILHQRLGDAARAMQSNS